jgi:hypothetical protein
MPRLANSARMAQGNQAMVDGSRLPKTSSSIGSISRTNAAPAPASIAMPTSASSATSQ